MKVTVNNYNTLVAEHRIPTKMQSFHVQLIIDTSENNWAAYYTDKDVKATLNLCFEKIQALTPTKELAPAIEFAQVAIINLEP